MQLKEISTAALNLHTPYCFENVLREEDRLVSEYIGVVLTF
jgi:hypothetical protein